MSSSLTPVAAANSVGDLKARRPVFPSFELLLPPHRGSSARSPRDSRSLRCSVSFTAFTRSLSPPRTCHLGGSRGRRQLIWSAASNTLIQPCRVLRPYSVLVTSRPETAAMSFITANVDHLGVNHVGHRQAVAHGAQLGVERLQLTRPAVHMLPLRHQQRRRLLRETNGERATQT